MDNKINQRHFTQADTPSLSVKEKFRFNIYIGLLEKAIAKLPETKRDEILTRFTESIEKCEFELPTPLIYEPIKATTMETPRIGRSR